MKRIPTPGAERRTFALPEIELRVRAGDSPGRLIGHAAVFDTVANVGRHREKVARGAFADSIRNDDIRALFNHNPRYVLGRNKARTLKLAEDEKGLDVEISLPDTSYARDLVESIRRGDVSAASIGFTTLSDDWEEDSVGQIVRVLKRVRLFDVSAVTYPAYPGTAVKVRTTEPRLERLRSRLELIL